MTVDARGYVHPRSEREICELVRYARSQRLPIRVRGAAHSVPAAIHTDARLRGGGEAAIEVMLDRFSSVRFDDARRRVTVEAGCRLGRDPRDPTGRSTVESGLCWQLEQRGWALPNLPGVSHVTVAGMLATGAAGGSVRHNLYGSIVSIRIVDGTGEIRELSAESDPETFHAAVVSMGLFGIVSSVTLQCEERFDVIGSETVMSADGGGIDLCGSGPGSLQAFLRETPYARVLWWPQRGVDRLVVWQARRMNGADYGEDTGSAWALEPRPYRAFDPLLGSTVPMQAAAGAALTMLGGWRGALERAAGPSLGKRLSRIAERAGAQRAESALVDAFVPESEPRLFWDAWWRALPMDDEIDERLLPTTFTEIWLPLCRAPEAMRRLRELYRSDPAAAGSFVLEIYAAGPSSFWMSPSFGEAALRLNVFWFERNPGDPREHYFPKFWRALADLGPRLHWAKLLPRAARPTAVELRGSYPKWDDFLRKRAELDPDGLFLTAYWRGFLGLSDPDAADPPSPLPRPEAFDAPAAAAPAFAMTAADAGWARTHSLAISVEEHLPAPPELAHSFAESPDHHGAWLSRHARTAWVSEPGAPDCAVIDVTFGATTTRLFVLETSPGRRWMATGLRCSSPLLSRLVIQMDFEPTPDGGTDVRARLVYQPRRGLGAASRLLVPFVRRAMQESLCRLARALGRSRRDLEASVTAVAPRAPRVMQLVDDAAGWSV